MIHLFNAFQYIYAWLPLGYGLLHPVMIPEYLNVLGAALYLWSASLYNQTVTDWTYASPATLRVHEIETASSLIEVFAALGWTAVWWLTHARGKGRGLTLDDPDFMGQVLIVVPSIVYFAYNLQNLKDPGSYGTNELYVKADDLYFAGSLFYVLCALRDDEWFASLWVFGAVWRGTGAAWAWERAFGQCASCEGGDEDAGKGQYMRAGAEAQPLRGPAPRLAFH